MSRNSLARVVLAVVVALAIAPSADAQIRLKLGRKTTSVPAPSALRVPNASVACLGGSVAVAAGGDIQAAINANPNGTAFCLAAGTYRERSLTPKPGNTFVGTYPTVMVGAKLLTSWTQTGAVYYVTGQTQSPIQGGGTCYAQFVMCAYAEDLWFNGVLKRRVDQLANVTPGTWFFDYTADRIYVGDNPSGQTVEVGTTEAAFTGSASSVTIKNITVEKYASKAQNGCVDGIASTSWVVQYVEIRYCHGIGLRVGPSMQASLSYVHDNYQLGVGGTANSGLVDNFEIANNNLQFDYGWEGGGTKFTYSNGFTISNSYVHNNFGPGIWFDIDNINFTVTGNTSEDNFCGTINAACPGIMIEISFGGSITNNVVRRNGVAFNAWLWGAGILVAASGGDGLDISGNTVEDNGDGIALAQQPRPEPSPLGQHLIQNVSVHNNTIKDGIGTSGAAADVADPGLFSGRNNHFESNTYLNAGTCNRFSWNGSEFQPFATWQATGNDNPVGSCTPY